MAGNREYEFTVRVCSSAPDVERFIAAFEREIALHWSHAVCTVVHRELDDLDSALDERMKDPEFAAAFERAEAEASAAHEPHGDVWLAANEYEAQINRLANFIMEQIRGEPLRRSVGAVDTAIRLLAKKYRVPKKVRDRYMEASS